MTAVLCAVRTNARDATATLNDWLVLTRMRIGGFVYFAALAGGLLAGAPGQALDRSAEAALWIALAGAAASVFNQVLEKHSDGLMRRTADRPLPSGRLKSRDALLCGTALIALSVSALALRFNLLSALLALATFASYTLVYTPLKRLTSLNTVVGAVPGAMPPMLGYVALAGAPGPWAWALFALIFAWQFPHFMAIGWLYREDYARAGIKMLPALQGARGMAGLQALIYSLAILPVSLMPWLQGRAGVPYASTALLLGLGYALFSARFARAETEPRARALLLYSLAYLPLLLSCVLLDSALRLSGFVSIHPL